MSLIPVTPTLFATPAVNPKLAGYGVLVPYISPSQYNYAPTAMDTTNLVQNGSQQDQVQSLYDTIRRVSGWADRFCFGTDPATKGASLCATQNTEDAFLKVLMGEFRLLCNYLPIISLDACAIGPDPSSAQSIAQNYVSMVRFGTSVIYIPSVATPSAAVGGGSGQLAILNVGPRGTHGRYYVIWTYTNGYPHTKLAVSTSTGSLSTLQVTATNAQGGLVGVLPGITQMRISDGTKTESFVIASVTPDPVTFEPTIHTAQPLQFAHNLPTAPDFLPVTTLPSDVEDAMIFATTWQIKSRGDSSVVLSDMEEPTFKQAVEDEKGIYQDFAAAMELLEPFRAVTRIKS